MKLLSFELIFTSKYLLQDTICPESIMTFNIDPVLFIALASLIVSILSFIYARKAYKFEVAKFQFDQSSLDIFIDFPETFKK